MSRIIGALAALALIVGACGGSNGDNSRDQLQELDPSITDEEADCLIDEMDARELSVEDVFDRTISDGPIPEEAQDAMLACQNPAVTDDTDGGLSEPGSPDTYGSDADLDALWDQCEAGDGSACDDLYFQSEIDSEYEEFGDTCGRRFSQSPGYCEEAMS